MRIRNGGCKIQQKAVFERAWFGFVTVDCQKSSPTIFRRQKEFVDPGPDSYYISQLVGCLVELADGTRVGEVRGVVRTGGTDLLRVESPRGEILIPFTRSICTRIEPELQRIRLVPPEGLLELNAV